MTAKHIGLYLIVIGMIILLGLVVVEVGAQTCNPPCGSGEVCKCTISGFTVRCECVEKECTPTPEPTATPMATGTPPTPTPTVTGTPPTPTPTLTPSPTFTPSPTPTPWAWCYDDTCSPGETRLTMFRYNIFGVPIVAEYLEDCCGPSCPCSTPAPTPEPCDPGTSTACSEWGASVQAELPVWYVNRDPFPRAMVTVPEYLWVSDANGNPITQLPTQETWGNPVDPGGSNCDCRANDTCDENPPPVGTICNFRLGLKAEPGNSPPTWTFEDGGTAFGYRVAVQWEHSSAGKPSDGRGLNCEPVPAFSVHATVPYWWYLGRRWEQWEKTGTQTKCAYIDPATGQVACYYKEFGCYSGPTNPCSAGWEDWETRTVDVYGWKQHGPNWVQLDMRSYGLPTPYMPNPRIQLAPVRPCGPHPVGVVYVPCIEVQGVISNPR